VVIKEITFGQQMEMGVLLTHVSMEENARMAGTSSIATALATPECTVKQVRKSYVII
jgi:hypothetical protein